MDWVNYAPGRLQWGHVFSDVETLPGHAAALARRVASMGPRLFRRGDATATIARVGRVSFNGATSFQTWRQPLTTGTSAHLPASMGPRLFRRGDRIVERMRLAPQTRFNGATSFQTWRRQLGAVSAKAADRLQWGHVFSDVETKPIPNPEPVEGPLQWGHVFSDVETTTDGTSRAADEPLQWGHVFSDVETRPATSAAARADTASMGPRLFRRGDIQHDGTSQRRELSFNGATSFQTWRQNPQPPASQALSQLQWGHVFSDVETRSGANGRLAPCASMGPRLFRRGDANCSAIDV